MKQNPATEAPEPSGSLIVATYNIHRCMGGDGQRDPERIARVIRETGATLVALQEVESLFEGEIGSHQLDYLSAATGLEALAGPTIYRSDSHYGNALLTGARRISVRRHDLSIKDCEPRGAVDAELDIAGYPVRVIAAHLGLHTWERDRQAKRLLKLLSKRKVQPTLILGDFNEWFCCGKSIRKMQKTFGRIPALRTYPSRFPLLALDRIWCWPQELLLAIKVHHSPLAKTASDHLPLVATLDLARLPGPYSKSAN